MPQPLSHIAPNAFVRHDPNALDDKPTFSLLVARIFGYWALIEHRLSLLLVRVLGAEAAPALAMFSTLTAQHLQLGALEAAAKVALTEQEFDMFKAAINITDSVQTPRNHLAHWIWASCLELPDALLLAEPKSAKERDREFMHAMDTGTTELAELAQLNSYDPSKVQVYREGDLQRASRDLEEASLIAFLVVVYLDSSFRGRRPNPPGLKGAITREQVFHQLCGQRLFREAWDRIQADRKKSRRPPT
jgi:hypothetical protein